MDRRRALASRGGIKPPGLVDWGRAIPAVLIVAGLALMLAPSALDWVRRQGDETVIQRMSSTAGADPQGDAALLEQAEAYNAQLGGYDGPEVGEVLPYDQQLRVSGQDQMCWVEAPAAAIRMPVYHGTSDDALAAGVGHLEGTSLPVGGESSHCVLTAHSGLGGSSGFDDIRQLQPGDRVFLHVLDQTLAYEVTGSEVVLPDETSSLAIRQGQDLLTLVTCTPYGVNDHRLLVHCRRVAYQPGDEDDEAQSTTVVVPGRDRVPLAVALAAAGGGTALLVARAVRGHHGSGSSRRGRLGGGRRW